MNFLQNRFHNLPLKRKLLLSFMVTSSTALALACIIFMINNYLTRHRDLLNEAIALADTLANNSTAAITFNDQKAAGELLKALKAHPHIDMAALYSLDGTEIALYVRPGTKGLPTPAVSYHTQNSDYKNIHVYRPIILDAEQIGMIYLRYNLSTLTSRQLQFLLLILTILLLESGLTFVIASRLMKYISEPVQKLVSVARDISLRQNYNIRAEQFGTDEIGILAESFNVMLVTIQERDRQLVLHHEQLEHQVTVRTHELATTNTTLKNEITERIKAEQARNLMEEELLKSRKLESIGILAGGIAHDFNNILTSVVGFISLTRNQTKDNVKIQEYLSNAEKGCFRAKNLTRQLLTFSRGGKPVRMTTSLEPIIQEAISISMAGSNVLCNLELPERGLYQVHIDAGQIFQVLNNLLINARQAMPDGGSVTVRADNISIGEDTVIPISPGDYVIVVIEDNGNGIPQQDIHRIFDPYFTTKPMGSGLGLATSYTIIKNHGGLISVTSELGSGAVFTLYLPVARIRHASETPVFESAPVAKNVTNKECKRVLIMDDDQMIRDLAADMLATLGHSVSLACDGNGVISMYREAKEAGEPYDVIIMDLTIPGGMGGAEAISKLLKYDNSACVIVSSGYANEPVMADYRSYGFRGAMPKPYTLDELEALLQSIGTL
ncbi:MAG: ATP-binding protein [Desulfuromonadales bacterium]